MCGAASPSALHPEYPVLGCAMVCLPRRHPECAVLSRRRRMTPDRPISRIPQVHRRRLMQAGAAAVATAAASVVAGPAAAQAPAVAAEEHWAKKDAVDLYLYRKRMPGNAGGAKPVLFLVHGSTFSSRGSFDLQVPGHANYSMMDHFAGLGFDVWTMDHEGYGRSSRTNSHAGIMVGV